MRAVRIACEIELGEPRLALAAGDRPKGILDVGLRLLARNGASRSGEKRADVGGVRSVRIAVEIGLEQVLVAVLSGEAPELRLGRLLWARAAGEIELLDQQGLVGGNLLSAGRGEHVVADRDHHAGDVGARRRQMSEQGRREGAVAAAAVERDIVGLGREGDEESGQLSDAREPGRGQATPARAKGLLRQASRKTRWLPLPLPSSASAGSSATVRVAISSGLRNAASTGTR